MKTNYSREIELISRFPKQEDKLKVLAFYIVLFQTFNMNNLDANMYRENFANDFDYNRKLLLDKSENVFLPSLEEVLKQFDENRGIQSVEFLKFAYRYVYAVSQRFYMLSERYLVPFDGYSAQQLIEPVENSLLISEIDRLKTGFSLKVELFIFIKNYLEKTVARISAFNSSRAIIGEMTSSLSSEIVENLREMIEQTISKDKGIDYEQLLLTLEDLASKTIFEYINKDSKMIYNFLPAELNGVASLENETDKKMYQQFVCHLIALDGERDSVSEEVKKSYGDFSDERLYTFMNAIFRFAGPNFPKSPALKKFVEERTSRKLIS